MRASLMRTLPPSISFPISRSEREARSVVPPGSASPASLAEVGSRVEFVTMLWTRISKPFIPRANNIVTGGWAGDCTRDGGPS